MTIHPTMLDSLRIATPCPMSWDTMRGDARVRFCDQCELKVFNISELSRNEAETLIASTEGRICAKLYRRADGTVLTKDCPVGLRGIRRQVTKRAAAVFAALASLCFTVLGQHPSKTSKQESCIPQTRITRITPQPDQNAPILSGIVRDPVGAVIPNAKVLLTDIRTKETQTSSSNDDGAFQIRSLADGKYSIKIEATNFKNHVVTDILVEKDKLTTIDVILEFAAVTVTVGILAEPSLIDRPLGTTIITGEYLRRLPLD